LLAWFKKTRMNNPEVAKRGRVLLEKANNFGKQLTVKIVFPQPGLIDGKLVTTLRLRKCAANRLLFVKVTYYCMNGRP
jgi:hypothetical protein